MAKDQYKGIVYQSPKHWTFGATRFIVTGHFAGPNGSTLILKLLDKPNYKGKYYNKVGYATALTKFVANCKIIQDNRNITEYIKDLLFG